MAVLLVFTFHYGSITMKEWNGFGLIFYTFTFHYGSITIKKN